MDLVIVESPTKAKTIGNFLGSKYSIEASYGHVVDLPKKELGVDTQKNFNPKYILTTRGRKIIPKLKKIASGSEYIYIATDPDREGEAIGYHIAKKITQDQSKIKRVVFHEITKDAIKQSFDNPVNLDENLFRSQQARRVLDRLVGYKLSPLLWRKVMRGLSAGRVQSAAIRLIVQREREREKFVPSEYWEIAGLFSKKEGSQKVSFLANLRRINGKPVELNSADQVSAVWDDLKTSASKVSSIKRSKTAKSPLPPFTTSTLQQTASNMYGFSAKRTMSAAQSLYEAGYITYHRTDSLNMSGKFVNQVRDYVGKTFGKNYIPEKARFYKTKSKVAQEAHECIRPTNVARRNVSFNTKRVAKYREDAKKVYDLIWKRAVASQMSNASYDKVEIKVLSEGKEEKYTFQASEMKLAFDGFLSVFGRKDNDEKGIFKAALGLKEKDELNLLKIEKDQHFTLPPPRYTTATLIKALEAKGIGRPSTYATIISTIQQRGYIQLEGRAFYPDDVAFLVNDLLVEYFPKVVDLEFTAEMENNLDKVARGELDWRKLIKDFYVPFEKELEKAGGALTKKTVTVLSTLDRECPECGKPLVIKLGRFGKFISCSGFPDCKYIESITEKIGLKCPECGEGDVIVRRTKKGRKFFGCSKYPKCKWASWRKPSSKSVKGEKEAS